MSIEELIKIYETLTSIIIACYLSITVAEYSLSLSPSDLFGSLWFVCCGLLAACAPNLYQCDNGQCVRRAEVCDGQNDCGDLSDELNCGRCLALLLVRSVVGPSSVYKLGRGMRCPLAGPSLEYIRHNW